MSDNWQVGDLALCIKRGPWLVVEGEVVSCSAPRSGGIYAVTDLVQADDGLYLGLRGFEPDVWFSERFRKIEPHEPDEEDAETIRELIRAPFEWMAPR